MRTAPLVPFGLALLAGCSTSVSATIPDLHVDVDFHGVAQTVPPDQTPNVPASAPFITFADKDYANVAFKVAAEQGGATTDLSNRMAVTSFPSGAGKPIYVVAPLGGLPLGAKIDVSITGDVTRQFSFQTSASPMPAFGGDIGFENATSGWVLVGDAVIEGAVGSLSPTEGAKQLVMTTGSLAGGNAVAGTSSFAVSGPIDVTGKSKLSFDYDFQSSEFDDYCNSSYDDTFLVVVTGANGSTSKVVDSVNLVCARHGDHPGSFPHAPDGGDDVFNETGKQTFALPIDPTTLGSPVSVTFVLTDVGDSILSSVVGVDDLKLE